MVLLSCAQCFRDADMVRRRFHAFYVSIAIGLVVAVASLVLVPGWAVTISAIAFFASYLVQAFRRLPKMSASFLRQHADQEDAPVVAIFLITALIVGVCVVSLFQVINSGGKAGALQLALSIVAVVLGWFVVHMLATYHYAYEFYEAEGGGLDFPGKAEPDGLAFLYFAYVIGMTAQVADVAITKNEMRKVVLIHSVFAFFFNTVIVAATVNVAVSVGGM